MKGFKILGFLMFALLWTACGDDDTLAPVVMLTSPTNNLEVTAGTAFPLTGTVTDETELRTIRIILGSTVETISTFDSPTSHSLNFSITIDSMSAKGPADISVEAVDASGNSSMMKRTIIIR